MMSEKAKTSDGLEGDIRNFVEAGTKLLDAGVRPVVRVLDILSDNLGERDAEPRIRLAQVSRTGGSVIDSTVRLAERVVTLALDIVGGSRDRTTGGTQIAVPAGRRGKALRIPMTVENSSKAPMEKMAFDLSGLRGPEGSTLSAASIKVEPEEINVAPGDFEKLVVIVDAPEHATPGAYEGELALRGSPTFRIPFKFRVQE